MNTEYDNFIEAMPEEWQLDDDSEEQVLINIEDYKALKRYNEDKLNGLAEISTTTER